jgi:hypothetical protein
MPSIAAHELNHATHTEWFYIHQKHCKPDSVWLDDICVNSNATAQKRWTAMLLCCVIWWEDTSSRSGPIISQSSLVCCRFLWYRGHAVVYGNNLAWLDGEWQWKSDRGRTYCWRTASSILFLLAGDAVDIEPLGSRHLRDLRRGS